MTTYKERLREHAGRQWGDLDAREHAELMGLYLLERPDWLGDIGTQEFSTAIAEYVRDFDRNGEILSQAMKVFIAVYQAATHASVGAIVTDLSAQAGTDEPDDHAPELRERDAEAVRGLRGEAP